MTEFQYSCVSGADRCVINDASLLIFPAVHNGTQIGLIEDDNNHHLPSPPSYKNNNKEEENVELSEKEERLARDYQLRRALDLIRGLSLFEESFEE